MDRNGDQKATEDAGTVGPRRGRAVRIARWAAEVAALATVFYLFVFQVSVVHGESMEPTLRRGDRLIVDKVSLLFCGPRRFDLVVFRSPDGGGKDYVKRVVGLPSEEVELRGDKVIINGLPLEQEFAYFAGYDYHGPTTVPAGCYFVLGDNRSASTDSRSWGDGAWVTRSHIKGVARMRVAPVSRAGLL